MHQYGNVSHVPEHGNSRKHHSDHIRIKAIEAFHFRQRKSDSGFERPIPTPGNPLKRQTGVNKTFARQIGLNPKAIGERNQPRMDLPICSRAASFERRPHIVDIRSVDLQPLPIRRRFPLPDRLLEQL